MSDTTPAEPSRDKSRYQRKRPKVPAFARYRGTSAWRGDRRRVRAYEWFMAKTARETPAAG